MQIQSVPPETTCLSCKRSFLLKEKLPLESMTIEFKNYAFPIKESFLKQILVKTIVAFMNSKGGTIFMGIDDSNGQVVGVSIGRKQMDEFRLMIKQMLEKVQPSVDLIKSEEVSVQFVPVLQGRQRYFYGKYVIKFIVLQGDPSKLYCVSQKANVTGNRCQEVQIISSYRRHNLGGIQEIKGIRVIHQIYEKARNPYKIFKTFHSNCNLQPIAPILLERPKLQRFPQIFVQEKNEEKIVQNKQVSSNSSQSSSQVSENDTIINKIRDYDRETIQQKERRFQVQPQSHHNLYFQNCKLQLIKSCSNFLKNSTTAKHSKEISIVENTVVVKFGSRSQKQNFLHQMENQKMRNLLNGFGISEKVNVLSFPTIKTINNLIPNRQPMIIKRQEKQTDQFKLQNFLIFKNYRDRYEESLQNYLQKCMTTTIERKMYRTKDGIELGFKSKTDLNLFYQMATKPPHSRQLSQYASSNSGIRIKVDIRGDIKEARRQEIKLESQKPKYIVKTEENPRQKIESKKFPSLLYQQVLKSQLQNETNEQKSDYLDLVASSLEPNQVPKLANYFTNNMFYNIDKKILTSKDKFYLRLVFNNSKDSKRFLDMCMQEPHKRLLPQFSGAKTLRIGVPGDNLLIHPYTENTKNELKKLILNLLGQGAIKKSTIKSVAQNNRVWSLTLVDTSKILECYQKLENFFRKESVLINQEYHKFRVFLDYQILNQ